MIDPQISSFPVIETEIFHVSNVQDIRIGNEKLVRNAVAIHTRKIHLICVQNVIFK